MSKIKKNFSKSAKFYDYFYKKKSYLKEAKYISYFFKKEKKFLLELGCGTASYSVFLAKKKNEILGIDKSPQMIAEAKKKIKKKKIKNINFKVADILEFKSVKKFDVCLMMFNVINYIDTDKKLEKLIDNIYFNLKKDGVVIFDQWKFSNLNKNNIKIKTIIINNEIITRKGTTQNLKSTNRLKIDYEYTVEDSYANSVQKFTETHYLKIHNIDKIKLLIKKKFKIVKYLSWMNYNKNPTKSDSQSFIVAKKINI